MSSLTTPDPVHASQPVRCSEDLPLWSPEPTRHGEVLVGDVGYIRHRVFYLNATKAADDLIHKEYGAPEEIPDDTQAFLRSVQPTIEVNADKHFNAIAAQTAAEDAEQPETDEQVQIHPDPNTEPTLPPELDIAENLERRLIVRHDIACMLLGLGADAHRGSYSANGLSVASGYEDSTIILWYPATGGCITELKGHTDTICALALSPDSSLLASCFRNRLIILWNVAASEKTVALNGHDGFIETLAFSRDGKKLASGSVDCTVRIWDVESGQQQSLCKVHNALVMVVTFSPDGTQLASGSADCDTRVWDAKTRGNFCSQGPSIRYEVPTPAPIPRDDTSTCKVVTVTVDDSAATSTVRLLFSVSSIWPETVQDNMPQSTITGEWNKAQNRACFEADVLKLRGNCW
ncbi:predicted protein [Postia placenta Mad-698-R]|uniref:Uncharacterized protein n=1 Tax=Postia placenta MAD-698-R-SB12 TaxID=670580 RepID=A0A1X6MQW9_9APHY|nr:hypothetical protein POSPLADRAFT_1152683 [Postia placenta MAD-698-R-SB12]EED78509.1 predicted protein [Postia placenta Mad-698-R]OSX58690.1 hypothetical protein POSPLADRAFT_1152683 [Postia placenta MAD-698-R-SB12]